VNINANITNRETNYFFYALLIYSITVLYLIPYELQLPHARICLPLLAIILVIQLCYYKSKLLITDIISVCLIILVTFASFSSYQLFRYSLPISLVAIGFSGCQPISIKRSYLIGLCWCATFAMIYQMTVYRRAEFDGSARITLSNGDPNVSGLFMLLFFFLSLKLKFKPGIILALVSTMMFFSRNYFISLVIFFFIVLFEKTFTRVASKLNFVIIFLIANYLGIVIGEYFLTNVEIGLEYDTGSSRLFAFNDKSNLVRFEANRLLIESYSQDMGLALTGYGEKYDSVFRPVGAIIHNSFLEVIAYTGIPLGILYFYVILRVVSGYYIPENFKFIFPYLFFCLFLHSGLQGVSPFLFISILAMKVED
jgi:hypothetical protein